MGESIFAFLDQHNVVYERADHPAVYTFEEANRLVPDMGAAHTKNVFLKDKKGRRHFLVMVGDGRRLDLAALSESLGVKKLSLASQDRLMRLLGVDPGSVSPLAVVNDPEGRVEVVFDRSLADEAYFQCHPLVNTSTLVLSKDELLRFLDEAGHPPRWLDIPHPED